MKTKPLKHHHNFFIDAQFPRIIFISDDSLLSKVNVIVRKRYEYLPSAPKTTSQPPKQLEVFSQPPKQLEVSNPSSSRPTQAPSTSNHLSFLLSLPPFNLPKAVQYFTTTEK